MEVNYKNNMISSFIDSNETNTSADNWNLIFIYKKYKFSYLLSIFIVKNNEINNYLIIKTKKITLGKSG